MRARKTVSGFAAITILAGIAFIAAPASVAEAGYVDSCGGTCQNIGQRVEEYDSETAMTGSCYGACGPGCSMVCSWGGACQTHDYYMRKHGLWSWQQFSTFPAALVQWGSCETGRGVDWVNQNIVSKVTGAAKWIGKKVAGIFN
ncbi:MAG TPA: hypothetical protein VIV40_28225 [Kofleriaceae bacterium]